MIEFVDISIVGFDDAATTPSGKGALMNMHLELSRAPDPSWANLFYANWKNYLSMNKRSSSIVHNSIVVVCLEDELQSQIDLLKQIIHSTNSNYKSALAKLKEEADKEEAAKEAQKARLADLKNSLKF